jgi:NADH-quinone oxidoreductase subunit D
VTRALTVGVGAAALAGADLVLDLGHAHPSAHGLLRVALELDGDTVVRAEPLVGAMHRGAEKLFEVRDYRQVLVLANRHDWLSAFGNELGIVLGVERMLGMEVPERAVWLRTLLAELDRAVNHLTFLQALPLDPPAEAWRGREVLQRVLEEASGGRVHYMFNQVGGLKQDVPAGWTGRVRRAVAAVRPGLAALEERLDDDPFAARARGTGVLERRTCAAYGVTGPVARASGHDLDLRRDDPYLAYAALGVGTAFPVVLGSAGDSLERVRVLVRTALVALDLVDACLDRLPPGAVGLRLPKTVKAPEGAVYTWTENPLGAMGYYLVSTGDKTPYRLAMRTPSFNNVSALPRLLPGVRLDDLAVVLGSLFFVVGDVDK